VKETRKTSRYTGREKERGEWRTWIEKGEKRKKYTQIERVKERVRDRERDREREIEIERKRERD